jgi:hypothetical protein
MLAGRLTRTTRRRHWFSGSGTPLPSSCRTSPRPAALAAEASVASFPIRVRTAAFARTATAGRRAGSRPAGPAGRSAASPGAMMTAGPGAARADAAILMSSSSASGAAKSGKFRREQQTGHSVFAATRLPLSDAADACGTARCGFGPTTGRSASPVPAAPWNAALTAGKNGSSLGRGPGAARGGASTASRGPPRSSQHLTMAQCRNPMSRASGWRCA